MNAAATETPTDFLALLLAEQALDDADLAAGIITDAPVEAPIVPRFVCVRCRIAMNVAYTIKGCPARNRRAAVPTRHFGQCHDCKRESEAVAV